MSPVLTSVVLLAAQYLGGKIAAESFKVQLVAELTTATPDDLEEIAFCLAAYELGARH